jgi:hypothetical protein
LIGIVSLGLIGKRVAQERRQGGDAPRQSQHFEHHFGDRNIALEMDIWAPATTKGSLTRV